MTKALLLLYTFLLPYEGLWVALFGSKTIFKPYRIVGLALLGTFLVNQATSKRRMTLDGFDFGFFLLIAGGYLMAVVWYLVAGSANLTWATHELTLLSFVYVLYLVIKSEIESSQEAERMLLAMVAGTVTSVLLSRALNVDVGEDHRVHGYFRNPNSLGVFAAMSILVLLARMLFGRLKSATVGYAVTGGLVLFLVPVLLSTGSRTPLLALMVAPVGLVLPFVQRSGRLSGRALSRVAISIPIVIGVGVIMATMLAEPEEGSVFGRYTLAASKSGSGRFDIWRSALRVAEDHYFLGVGMGQYRYHHQVYVKLIGELYSPGVYKHALGTHSDYVSLITCYGLPLTLLYLAMMVTLYRRLMGRIRQRTAQTVGFAVPALLSLLVFVLINQTGHNMLQGPAYFYVLSIATVAVAKRDAPSSPRAASSTPSHFAALPAAPR